MMPEVRLNNLTFISSLSLRKSIDDKSTLLTKFLILEQNSVQYHPNPMENIPAIKKFI